jgi:hypothetical protein
MKSIRLRTQRVTLALEIPGRVAPASTAELFSPSNPSVNDLTHLAENPKLAKCLALLIGNGSLQAPYLDHSLANGNHLSAFSNSADSAIATGSRGSRPSGSSECRVANLGVIVRPPAGEHDPLPKHAIAVVTVQNVRALVFASGASLCNKRSEKGEL